MTAGWCFAASAGLTGERFDMIFIGKPRHVIVGLRFEVDPVDAALGEAGEQRQLAAMQQGMDTEQ